MTYITRQKTYGKFHVMMDICIERANAIRVGLYEYGGLLRENYFCGSDTGMKQAMKCYYSYCTKARNES